MLTTAYATSPNWVAYITVTQVGVSGAPVLGDMSQELHDVAVRGHHELDRLVVERERRHAEGATVVRLGTVLYS